MKVEGQCLVVEINKLPCLDVQEALLPESPDMALHDHRVPGQVPPPALLHDSRLSFNRERPLPSTEGDEDWYDHFQVNLKF